MTYTNSRKMSLDDKYTVDNGTVLLTGTQALIRLMLMQKKADERDGLKTAGYVSGYRGSPLGSVDLAFARAKSITDDAGVRFHPALNEDLAATAIWGTQQVGVFEPSDYQGVFSMWYGKGPGVHRSGDVFLHANLAGTSRYGGVLALGGDDHVCKSSTNAHQSEFSFIDAMIPTLNPAGVQDILDFGLYGWAMSRYSGAWSAMKLVSEAVDCSMTVQVGNNRCVINEPHDFELPESGLGLRWPDPALDQERRLHEWKLPAAQAFARANNLDRTVISGAAKRIGIVTTGKSYLDTRQALEMLGIDEEKAKASGISLYKVGLVWPLEPEGIKLFCSGLEQVVVIEEKRALLEPQVKDILYNIDADKRPSVFGKTRPGGETFLPSHAELNPTLIASQLMSVLPVEILGKRSPHSTETAVEANASPAVRTPYFCSGCPHNTSTKVPVGSKAFAGIGCHYMAQWMDRSTEGFTHMGGEGVNWIGLSDYTPTKHMFQNIGDGTYFHSGYLAIRAAIAADVNMTYRVLFNAAVAMTGGQPMDGDLSPAAIACQMVAEGAAKVVVVSDDIKKYSNRSDFPDSVTLHGREEYQSVLEDLREISGVTIVIYDQECAAEKRRNRKRGVLDDPPGRMIINELVCEGCGDCSVASNCLSVTPVETEYGVKRRIDQSTCNKDYSCANGFCPSFVSVTGGKLREGIRAINRESSDLDFSNLKTPPAQDLDAPTNILVTGVGGTGVVTIGALLTTAAHIEGRACSTLDMAGMAQKGGPVTSHIRIASETANLHTVRISPNSADLILGCDLVVTAGQEALSLMRAGETQVIVNATEITTSEFVKDRNYRLPADLLKSTINATVGSEMVQEVEATELATRFLGNSIGSNLFLVGVAFQSGFIPLSEGAILQAIKLNGVAVEMNTKAFNLGRLYVQSPEVFEKSSSGPTDHAFLHRQLSETNDERIQRRYDELIEYQNEAYADRYLDLVETVRTAESRVSGGDGELTEAVARNAFKLMAYKDEYEVARLFSSKAFKQQLEETFEGDFKLKFHLAPPSLSVGRRPDALPKKREFGGYMAPAFRLLATGKVLRGTYFDPFGLTEERRTERMLRDQYEADLRQLCRDLSPCRLATAVKLARLPDQIRGFGHVKLASIEKAQSARSSLLAHQGAKNNDRKTIELV